ncbi:MAG: lytic transglycosylase domain-containing protein [Salinivirgaceae bacterium]|nr:lytic transglycosylase domain-containing protein [Salinivirgaceae bacterium]
MKNQIITIIVSILVSGAVAFFVARHFQQPGESVVSQVTDAVPMPDKLTFMGEPVPIHNFDTRESLDRELQVNRLWHSQTILMLKRANRYFPIIEPILKENGVPDDLKYIAVIESSLTNVVSPSGAKGFWQFLSGTAKDFGLEVNDEVDERYNLEKATVAAIDYFKRTKEKFGSWTMAAASYNIGRAGLLKQVGQQKCNNYYDLVLGEETERYIFRAIAIKQIMENPEMYGFTMPKDELYHPIPYTVVSVDSTIADIADFAFEHGTNYKMLKMMNPWLRATKLTNPKRKTYQIKIIDPKFRMVEIDTQTVVMPQDIELN